MDAEKATVGNNNDAVGGLAETGNKSAIIHCEICKNRNTTAPATQFCLKCRLYLCHGCDQQHENVWGADGNHETVNLEGGDDNGMRKYGDVSLEGEDDNNCSKHGDVSLEGQDDNSKGSHGDVSLEGEDDNGCSKHGDVSLEGQDDNGMSKHGGVNLESDDDNNSSNHGDVSLKGENGNGMSNYGNVQGREPIDLKGIDRCETHNRVFVYYCENHKAFCCEDCHFHEHKVCNDVHKITDRADEHGVVDNLLVARLVNTISLAHDIVKNCEEKSNGFKQEKQELLKHFDRQKLEIIKLLDEARERLEQEIDENLSANKDRLNNTRSDAETVSENLEQVLQLSKQVNKHGSGVEKVVLNFVGHLKSKVAEQKFEHIYENEYTSESILKWNDNVIQMLQTHDPLVSVQEERVKPAKLKLLKTGRLQKTWRDKLSPRISGLDFLPDGRVTCADNYNRKVFILNGDLQRVGSAHTFDATSNPRDVACCNLEMIAVTLNTKTIALLSVSQSSKFLPLKTLTITFDCFSIASLDPTMFLVGTVDHTRPVCTVDIQGQVKDIKRLDLPDKTFGLGDSVTSYMPSTKTVLLTDNNDNSLLICDISSGQCKTVKDDGISSPKGVCGGPNGTVFVCSSARDSIVQISLHGEVVSNYRLKLPNPSAMAISQDSHHLVVCNHGEDQDTIIQLFKIR